jgi:hypothetical protein
MKNAGILQRILSDTTFKAMTAFPFVPSFPLNFSITENHLYIKTLA